MKGPFDIQTCARPNILLLQPYRCARDDYKDDGSNILLDANENAYGPGLDFDLTRKINGHTETKEIASFEEAVDLRRLNRYPDPHQHDLKQLLCSLRNTHHHTQKKLTPDHLFVGVGSDEAIDNLLRCFCAPGKDKILVCPPTYGMYDVSAAVNDVGVTKVPLLAESNFDPDVPSIMKALMEDPSIKITYLCSPGNPTGALIPKEAVTQVLAHPTWNGVVVVDEAYVDFATSPSASLAELVMDFPNLVVMQTLSKAFGLAGIRLGAAFTSPQIARLLNSLKAPYNVSSPTSQLAMAALQPHNLAVSQANIKKILSQRQALIEQLPGIPGVGRFRGGFEANFLLVEILDAPRGRPSNVAALEVYQRLAESKGVVVRFRGKELGCTGCLRITVGTEEEVTRFLKELSTVLNTIYDKKIATTGQAREGVSAEVANNVVA